MLLAIDDITARQQAEATLRQQRDVLAVTLGSIGDAVMITDPHGSCSSRCSRRASAPKP